MSIEDQPPPVPNERPAIWDLVIADMRERDTVGRKRYGTPLQAGNGRDALVDAYQEALDLAAYLRQEIEERKVRGVQVKIVSDDPKDVEIERLQTENTILRSAAEPWFQ